MTKREDETVEHTFDELSKGAADGNLSRSGALKSVGAAIVGAVLSMFALPRNAEAAELKTLWAIVNADGTLVRGKGVTRPSKSDTGEYTIKFQQDVSRCSCSATLQNNSGFVFLDTVRASDSLTQREVGGNHPGQGRCRSRYLLSPDRAVLTSVLS
jgi:hypothetical protein